MTAVSTLPPQLPGDKLGFAHGIRGGRFQDPDCRFGHAEPLQHLLVVFLFGDVMNAQTGECLDRLRADRP